MLTRNQKQKVVEGLTERFARQKISIFADIHGISVAKLAAFRRELKNIGAELKVAKKTLLTRALGALGVGIEPKALEGELGVIFGYQDQLAPARAAAKFARENKTFRVLRGVLGSKMLESWDILALAKLPSREELLAKLVRALAAPIQSLVNVLPGNMRNLVVVLSQIKK